MVCDRSQHICPITCVIAQQYSSVIRLNASFMEATPLCLLLYKLHLFGLPQHVYFNSVYFLDVCAKCFDLRHVNIKASQRTFVRLLY